MARTEEQLKKKEQRREAFDKLTDKCADFVDKTDQALDRIGKFFPRVWSHVETGAAAIVIATDNLLDKINWRITKIIVFITREIHSFRMYVYKYRQSILKIFSLMLISITGVVGLLASQIDYQYSYNGRALGIVHEQQDVLQVVGLASEELSVEYGSNIEINPETDIEFKKVFSSGRDIDTVDDVLRRFTYMGDIQVTAYGIYKDGMRLCIVDSEKTAESVLQSIMDKYMKDDDTEYISVGFAENVEIKPISTVLANVGSKANALSILNKGEQQEQYYEAVAGDTLSGICSKLGITMKELKEMNPNVDEKTLIHIGQKFKTQVEVPFLTIRTEEISTFAEPIKYETEKRDSDAYYQGEEVVYRAGKKGKQKVTARLWKENGEIVDREDLKIEVITEPVSKIVLVGTKKVPPKQGTGTFIKPVNVGVYRAYGMRWGRMHEGHDYAAPSGTAIHASDGGTVTKAGWSGAYGYRIVIEHGANMKTLYAHCSKIYVNVGDKVYQGQTIGAVGSTGRSTGPHCHFEIFKNGENVNPANYVGG